MNLAVFYYLYAFSFRNSFADRLIIFFGDYYVYALVVIVLVAVLLMPWSKQKKIQALIASFASALIARFVIGSSIRFLYYHPRPYTAFNLPHLLTDPTSSFPSGHTIFIFGLATALYFYSKPLAYFVYASGLVIGVARIIGGVHYPYDILGGIVLGILTGIIVVKILPLLKAFPRIYSPS